jgi:hypothetical protein
MKTINDQGIILTKSSIFPWAGIWIPILYGFVLILLSPLHGLFSEWGGVMQYFSGQEILMGKGYHGWASHFWPPLYSILIALGSKVLPAFLAGKLISILASVELLFIAFLLTVELSGQWQMGILTQIFLAVNPLYFYQSLWVHNHMLDALFFSLGLLLFIKFGNKPTLINSLITGMVCGLAGLTRYTSYVLIFIPYLYLITAPFKKIVKFALVFWTGFSLINLPWWYQNAVSNGSPFYNWNYLNLCAGTLYHEIAGSNLSLWRCAGIPNIIGLAGLLTNYPLEYIYNIIRNIPHCIEWLVVSGGVMGPFTLPAILENFINSRSKYTISLLGLLSLSIIFISQGFVFPYSWFLFPWLILLTVLSVAFIRDFYLKIQGKYSFFKKYGFGYLLIIVLALYSIKLSANLVGENQISDSLVECSQITNALKKNDVDLINKVIMASDPARAFYAGSKYLMTPPEYNGPLEGLVSYEGISERLKNYAPKIPSDMSLKKLKADYLILTKSELSTLPQFLNLFDPKLRVIPENFHLIYESAKVVVLEIL